MPGAGGHIFAVALGVIGTSANNIGKVLQKRATHELPQLSMERKVLLLYATHPVWRLGLLADVGGAVVTLWALALAPVSLVQPVGGCGMAILAIFSRFYLREEIHVIERVGVAMAVLGTVGVGMTSNDASEHAMPNGQLGALLLLLLAGGFAALEAALKHASGHAGTMEGPGPRLQEMADASGLGEVMIAAGRRANVHRIELIAGLQAGLLFGLSAASARTAMLLAHELELPPIASLGVASSVALSAIGIFCQNRGMKDGRAMFVCTYAAIATIVTGVVVGLLALNEALPRDYFVGWCLSLLCILAGVGLLTMRRGDVHAPKVPPPSADPRARTRAHPHCAHACPTPRTAPGSGGGRTPPHRRPLPSPCVIRPAHTYMRRFALGLRS